MPTLIKSYPVLVGNRQRLKGLYTCTCGNSFEALKENVDSGKTTSCGCIRKRLSAVAIKKLHTGEQNLTHGNARKNMQSPEYNSWVAAKARCFNSKNHKYKDYGGRGITMCQTWKNSFESFLQDMGQRPKGTSLGRINNDGNYEPTNCRWETPIQQRNNRRDTCQQATALT